MQGKALSYRKEREELKDQVASLNQELANQEASVMSLSDDMKKQAADYKSKMATLAPAGTVSALRIELAQVRG